MQVVSFCCNWCSYAGADLAGSTRLEYPAEVKIIRVPCSCRVDPLFILRAFERGADGVIVNGCHPGDCHYSTGNYYTRRRMTLLFNMLDFLGIERERVRLDWVSAAEGVKFATVMNDFVKQLYSVGELSIKLGRTLEIGKSAGRASPTPTAEIPVVGDRLACPENLHIVFPQIAHEMLESGEIDTVLGWQKGELPYETAPAFFSTPDELQNFTHDSFCGANLSKYLVENSDKKVLVFLKPCDTYSLNQLLAENRVKRENIHAIGIGCSGMLDIKKIRNAGISGILDIKDDGDTLDITTMYGNSTLPRQNALLEKCLNCKGKAHMIFDAIIGTSNDTTSSDKFAPVTELEGQKNRNDFWRSHLSNCIRCNACRNVCPACTCKKCVFDNPHSGVAAKVNTTEFEENHFHIIRAYHVAGRCTDCGECSRVCPENVPLHLLNRKFIKDINELYGEYQAGETAELSSPLLKFDQADPEPNQEGGSNV